MSLVSREIIYLIKMDSNKMWSIGTCHVRKSSTKTRCLLRQFKMRLPLSVGVWYAVEAWQQNQDDKHSCFMLFPMISPCKHGSKCWAIEFGLANHLILTTCSLPLRGPQEALEGHWIFPIRSLSFGTLQYFSVRTSEKKLKIWPVFAGMIHKRWK